MPFMRFLYFLLRLSILLILTILPYLSLCTGHMVRFNAVYAPHVPQTRTHGAPERRICPTCPSAPDTWRTSTHFNSLHAPSVPQTRTHGAPGRWRKYIKAWRRVGRFREAEKEAEGGAVQRGGEEGERWGGSKRRRRRRTVGRFREAEKEAEEDGSGLNSATP